VVIKGIFFDAAGVFYRRPQPTESYMLSLLMERGFATELSAQDRTCQKALRSQADSGQLGADEYWDRVLELHGVDDSLERSSLLAKIYAHHDNVLAIPGGREAVAQLKRRGFLVGIITDTMHPIERKMQWVDKVGVAEFVDVVTCSTTLGTHKPAPLAYLDALQQAHLSPDEAAFVGHATDELEGAQQVGMTTVAVNYDPGTVADYYAESLLDLLNVPIFASSTPVRGGEDMNHNIQVIFIDVGATLRYLVEDEPYQANARRQIAALIGTDQSPEAFCEMLDARYKVYRKWAFETLREAPESELWSKWMLPDWPAEKTAPLAGQLTYLYRQTMGHRHAQPDAKEVVVELTRRGYQLGILSNTITEREIPEWLEQDGLSQYFPTVVLSSIFGYRKPGPEIFWEAARRAGCTPAQAVYVADNPSRDVPGSRRAGFGMMIIMGEPDELAKKDLTGENKPDLVIHTLSELLDIFPPRQTPADGS
jgi:HAD superfamily hydrolase (TIGR01509 family)/HAD superfamily hydrolase (TIGR01549 family)